MENEAGGYLVGRKNGKLIAHNKGDLGGILVGRRHSTGGIDGVNVNTGQSIEVETEEVQIASKAASSGDKKKFEGQLLTNKEILSKLNVEGGGRAFKSGGKVEEEIEKSDNVVYDDAGKPIEYSGGEIILTRGAVSSDKKYDFNGKKMTTREIASAINEEAGGVAFAEGGKVSKGCSCIRFEDGGSLEQTLERISNTKIIFKHSPQNEEDFSFD